MVVKDVPDYAIIIGNPGKQKGWMSEHGQRLIFDEEGNAICSATKTAYRLLEGRVTKSKNYRMKNFVLTGAAGYIAPMLIKAIKETGNNLIASLDKHDSVGILDSFFPDAYFFTEFERFDRHLEKLKREGIAIKIIWYCARPIICMTPIFAMA